MFAWAGSRIAPPKFGIRCRRYTCTYWTSSVDLLHIHVLYMCMHAQTLASSINTHVHMQTLYIEELSIHMYMYVFIYIVPILYDGWKGTCSLPILTSLPPLPPLCSCVGTSRLFSKMLCSLSLVKRTRAASNVPTLSSKRESSTETDRSSSESSTSSRRYSTFFAYQTRDMEVRDCLEEKLLTFYVWMQRKRFL